MDEGTLKRGLFKHSKTGNVEEFHKFICEVPQQKKKLQLKCK